MAETIRKIIKEHKTYKNQILMLAKSDLIKTYRGAALGWAWAIIKPMITLFVFWFAFSIGLRHGNPVEGYSYFLWLTAGFLPWFYMQELITGGAGCIRKYSHLVTKMRFPISIIPTYYNLSHLYIHLALLIITMVLFICAGHMPDIYLLQIPIYMLMMVAFFIVYSLLTGMLSAISKDFQNLVRSLSTVVFWMSGIIYSVDDIPSRKLRIILKFNPVTVISSGYRRAFIYKKWFWQDKVSLCCFLITFIIFIILALRSYKKLREDIPDVL
ncbi:MAG: ABC transporter permease [Mogibacterium sp.]|nr:ABC transporter permease [Mogibacterium sp.]